MRRGIALAVASAAECGAFRTSWAPRPGYLVPYGFYTNHNNSKGEHNYYPRQAPDAAPPFRAVPKGDDFVAVGAGKDMAMALRVDGRAELWGKDKFDGWAHLDEAQPRSADGRLQNASDAFVTMGCGRGHWLGVKRTGELVSGGGYEKPGFEHGAIPEEVRDILAYELPRGGRIIKVAGGGGISVIILRRHNETSPGETGTLHAWTFKGFWDDKKWTSSVYVPSYSRDGFSDISCGNKQVGVALRPDGSTLCFGWNDKGQSNPINGTVLDAQSGGYKTAWMTTQYVVQGTNGWSRPPPDAHECKPGWRCDNAPFPGKRIASLEIGYSTSGLLQTDGTVVMHVQKDTSKGYEMYPMPGEVPGVPGLENRSDVLAMTPGNGMLFIIADPSRAPVEHAVGAGRDPPKWWPGDPPPPPPPAPPTPAPAATPAPVPRTPAPPVCAGAIVAGQKLSKRGAVQAAGSVRECCAACGDGCEAWWFQPPGEADAGKTGCHLLDAKDAAAAAEVAADGCSSGRRPPAPAAGAEHDDDGD